MTQERTRALALASIVVLAGFLASRVSGLVRDVVVLGQFGTGREYEAYLAAMRIPDLVFQVLLGGAVGSAFIPVFAHARADGDGDGAWRIARALMTAGFLAGGVVALVAIVGAERIADLLVPGWDDASRELTARLMRIVLVTPAIFAVSCVATSILQSFDRFAAAAAAPVAYNLAIIAGAVLLRPLGIEGVAYGVALGATLHVLVQVPSLLKTGFPPRPLLDLAEPGLREVGRLMLPRTIGLAVVQVNFLANVLLASFLVAGSLAYLNVGWLMIMTPLALAMSVSTAFFPTLAAESALAHREEVRRLFGLAWRMILFLTLPAAVGLATLSESVIALFFQRGDFTATSTVMTAAALLFFAIGLPGHATTEIVARVFYALHDTRTPVAAAIGAMLLNLGLSLTLMQTDLNYRGLALANGVAALAEAAVLLWLVRRRIGGAPRDVLSLSNMLGFLARVCLAAGIMGAFTIALKETLLAEVRLSATVEQAIVVAVCIAASGGAYFVLAHLLGLEEPAMVFKLLRRR